MYVIINTLIPYNSQIIHNLVYCKASTNSIILTVLSPRLQVGQLDVCTLIMQQ